MQVTLLTGFLGAGKTTFLKRLLHEQADRRFGVIVNDLSELEVDGELVRLGHAVGEEAGTLVSLTDGSISGSCAASRRTRSPAPAAPRTCSPTSFRPPASSS